MALGDNSDWGVSGHGTRPAMHDPKAPFVVRSGSALYDGTAEWSFEESRPESSAKLLEYWRVIIKHRWVVLAVLILCLAAGVAATLLTRPIYTAGTTIQIDRESSKILKGDDMEPQERFGAGEEFFQTQYGLLKSKSLAVRVVDDLGLARNDTFMNAMGVKADPKIDTSDERKRLVLELLQGNLAVAPVRGSRLVKVSFSSPDRDLSARIANSFADSFIASNIDRRFESSAYARDFLERRIAQVKGRLEDTERQLVAYATSRQIINVAEAGQGPSDPGATQSLVSSTLIGLNDALTAAKTERIRAEQKWRQAARTPGLGVSEILQSPTIQQLSQDRSKLVAQYQEKLSVLKPGFPEMVSLRAQIDETDKQINLEATAIRNSMRAQYEAALSQERVIAGQVEATKSSVFDLRNRSIEYNILQREVDTNRTLYDGLLQRYKEISVAGGVTANNISIVDRADAPPRPSKPRPLINMVLALAAGMGLGVLSAFVLAALDESIHLPEDVETKLGLPMLGSTPLLEKGVAPVAALLDVRSAFSEAYYSIRTALQFSTPDGAPPAILVTSTRPSEGKSTTAFAVALNFSRLGMRTLLIDGDLRNPSMHRTLGADNSVGLANVLTGSTRLDDAVQPTSFSELSFIPCGPLPPNPAELLAGGRLRAMLHEAKQNYDIVVIDGPPVMGLADAPMLASIVGDTIMVVTAGGTRRSQAKGAIRRLRVRGVNLLGVVLTKFDARQASYGYGYNYAYEYSYGLKNRLENT